MTMSNAVATPAKAESGAVAPARVRLSKPADLTPEEEQQLATLYAMCEKGQRFLLLEAFERNAHKAYNKSLPKGGTKVANFEEWAHDRLSLGHDASYYSRLIGAARVERAIAGESFNMLKLASGPSAKEQQAFKPRLTIRAAEAISKLPEEEWQKVYEEATKIPGETTPSELSSNIQRIAGRRDRELHPDKPKPGRKAGAVVTRKSTPPDAATNLSGVEGLPGTKANLTPIVPPTYIDTPEQLFREAGGTAEEWEAQQAQEAGTAAPGEAQETSTPEVNYRAMEEENAVLRSFLKTFLSLMEMKELDVAALHTLYNDGSEWAKAHSL